jgi:hypothetical protein
LLYSSAVGKTRFISILLCIFTAVLVTACAPGLRPHSNAFVANGPTTSIPITTYNSPHSSGPTVQEIAKEISYGPWSRDAVHSGFSKSILNLYTAAMEWDEAQGLYRVGVSLTLSEIGGKETALQFSVPFTNAPRKNAVETVDQSGKYALSMICASDDCNEKIFKVRRKSDNATALIKNVRAEEVLVPSSGGDGVPVVQHYMEVKDGIERRHITDRDGSARDLEPYLKNPDQLKKATIRRAIDVPVLTEKNAPGISRKSPSQKLVWIGELMIREKMRIPQNACNRYVLYNLAAGGYRITSEPNAHNFLSLLVDPQFNGWRTEKFHYVNSQRHDLVKLAKRLDGLPERKGVILQYGRGSGRHGHVAILFREGSKFYVMDSSLNEHPPEKNFRKVTSLLNSNRKILNIMFPPDVP